MSDFNQAPAAEPQTAPAAPAAPPQAPAAPATGGTPSFQATPQAPAAPSTPQVDPSWLKQRLDETRQSAYRQAQTQLSQQFGTKETEYQAKLSQLEKQLQALVGVTPQAKSETDDIRARFQEVFPDLMTLEQRAKDLLAMAERAGDFESSTNHYWQSYGRQALDRLYSKASETLGVPLTDEGRNQLRTSFIGWVQSSPDLVERYSSDPTIVEDFMKAFTSSFIDPVRRNQAAGIQGRVPSNLPQDTPGGAAVRSMTPAPAFKDLDERAAAAFAQFSSLRNG